MCQPKIRRTAEQRYVNSNGFAEKQRGGPTRVNSMELPCSSTGKQSRRRNATIEIHLARASVPAAVLERTTLLTTVTTSAPCVQVSSHARLALLTTYAKRATIAAGTRARGCGRWTALFAVQSSGSFAGVHIAAAVEGGVHGCNGF